MWTITEGEGFFLTLKNKQSDILWGTIHTPLGGEEIHSNSVCCALESSSSTRKESCSFKCYMKNLNMSENILKMNLICTQLSLDDLKHTVISIKEWCHE